MKKIIAGVLTACFILGMWTVALAGDVSLYFKKDSITLSAGRYVTMHVYESPRGDLTDNVRYSIADATIASISRDGKLRGLSSGETTLTATSKSDSSISVSIPVQVIVPAEGVKITADQTAILIGDTVQLSYTIKPSGATIKTVVYSSSDESVATVTQAGLVTGIKRGEVTIKAVSGDGKATDYLRITIKQPPNSVTVSPETVTVAEGKTKKLTPTVLPKDTNDKTVLWTSADESVATVSDRGVVTGVKLGNTVITATCKDNTNATNDVPVTVTKLATSVSFDKDSYDVLVGDTIQLTQTVFPSNTSDQSVTYKVRNSRIATVDANGLVTALKGGSTTVTVTTADGSRKSATVTIQVVVPVTGVRYSRSDIRVGERHYGHFTVSLEPSDATNHNMTWTTADPSIATVSGSTTTFKIVGADTWGRTTVTGVTEDGGYSITLNVNVGSLYRAVTVRSLEIYNGKPYITLRNNSGMVITQVSYFMQGMDANQQPIDMSTTGDLLTLYGTYDLPLYPGYETEHGRFTFNSPTDYPGLTYLIIVVTGWRTSTGYYDSNGNLQYDYPIPESHQELVIYPADADPSMFRSNGNG